MRNGCPLRSDALGCQSVQFISIHSKMRVQETFYYIVLWLSLVILSSLSKTGSRVLFIPGFRDSLRWSLEPLHRKSITSVRRRKRIMVSLISISPSGSPPLTYSTNREDLNPNPTWAFLKFSPSFVWSPDTESSSASSLFHSLHGLQTFLVVTPSVVLPECRCAI